MTHVQCIAVNNYDVDKDKRVCTFLGRTLFMVLINKELIEDISRGEILLAQIFHDDDAGETIIGKY